MRKLATEASLTDGIGREAVAALESQQQEVKNRIMDADSAIKESFEEEKRMQETTSALAQERKDQREREREYQETIIACEVEATESMNARPAAR